MTKTLIKSRFNPKNKIKPQTELSKNNTACILPQNLQNFKQKLFSGNGFITLK